MNIWRIFSKRNLTILGYIIGLISIGLIGREIHHFIVLPRTDEVPETIDLFKYKETTIGNGYFWILTFLLGYGLVKKNMFGWIIPQTVVLIGLAPFILIPAIYGINSNDLNILILGGLYLIICCIIFWLLSKGKAIDFFNIDKSKLIYHYVLILILTTFYELIDLFIY